MAPIASSDFTPAAALARQAKQSPKSERPLLPVTLLSGFLGSGKTTLLEYILKSKDHGLRCCVIVNDIGQLNIDASLLSQHAVTQKEEKVVEMQNGCVCCTLRGDLLEEIVKLSQDEQGFDYLLIESTGVSEPQQVAEAFAPEFAEMHIQAGADLAAEANAKKLELEAERRKSGKHLDTEVVSLDSSVEENLRLAEILGAGGLPKVARLDTCVTVVDACNLLANFDTSDFLSDRHAPGTVDEQDERNISDLLVDQLEFADVIIINKIDLVSPEAISKIKSLIKTLNPSADILTSIRSKVDLKRILDTHRFSFEKSMMAPGWLQSLKEVHTPETEEYGIGTLCYRARRPFAPLRLWEVIRHRLVIIQDSYEAILEGMDITQEGSDSEDDEEMEDGEDVSDTKDVDYEAQPQLDPVARLAAKRADPAFGPLLRSKGFIWLATRPEISGEWSQAGCMLTIAGGARWMCCTPDELWPDDADMRKQMKDDYVGPWGDRRQEIVLIGENMAKIGPLLTAELDGALLNDAEWKQWQKIMNNKKLTLEQKVEKLEDAFDDGFEDWMDPLAEEEGHEGHNH